MLETDSLIEVDHVFSKLYHYLWSATEFTIDKLSKIKVRIPDTVIFKNFQPRFWYFTDNEGFIKKKKPENHSPEIIMKEFLRKARKNDVIAYFIQEKKLASTHSSQAKSLDRRQEILYLNESAFREFMIQGNFPDGLLQHFIEPVDEWNTLIETIWSKSVCIFTKRRNRKKLGNTKLDPYERCCTFDGPEHFSEKVPMRGNITETITETCNSIIRHIDMLSYGRFVISRLCLYFKQDSSGIPHLLYGSSIRMKHHQKTGEGNFNVKPLTLEKKLEIPENINILTSINLQKPLQLKKDLICYDCEKPELPSCYSQIPFSIIIEHKRQDDKKNQKIETLEGPEIITGPYSLKTFKATLKARGYENDIPPIFRKLYPRMSCAEYLRKREEPEFKNRVIAVCDKCYLKYSDSSVKVNVFKIKPVLKQFKGTESLECTQSDKIKLNGSKQARSVNKSMITDFMNKCKRTSTKGLSCYESLQGILRPRTSVVSSTISVSKMSQASGFDSLQKTSLLKSQSQHLKKLSLDTNDFPKLHSEFGSLTTYLPDEESEIDNQEKYLNSVNREEMFERYKNQRQLKKFLSQDARNLIKKFQNLYQENGVRSTTGTNLVNRNYKTSGTPKIKSLKGFSNSIQQFGSTYNWVECNSPLEPALQNTLNDCNKRSMTSSSSQRPKIAFSDN